MICNYIIISLAGLYLLLSIISAITEEMKIKKASVRNFFRFIRINLREVTLLRYIVIIILTVWLSGKFGGDPGLTLAAIGGFTLGVVILEYHLIFGERVSVKWKEPMMPLPETPVAKELPETPVVGEVPEAAVLEELPTPEAEA